jgi:hypothetical protein
VPRFRIVPARSRVWIRATSNVHPIHSEATGLDGWLDLALRGKTLDPAHTPAGHLEFPVALLSSGNPLETRELRRRIEARRHPTIAGDLRAMTPTNTRGAYLVRGDLTFRGVTRTYEDRMTLDVTGRRTIALRGESIFDIRDFGMEPPRILIFKVEPDVHVRVELVAERDA